ncbi:MAG TPA: zinc ABC transporter substrate-binding protein [Solirubrobacteraceae bacterium]|nr:zinc ABC transporter substrate-binding protein [Solirubrobacteraceae bacterium]
MPRRTLIAVLTATAALGVCGCGTTPAPGGLRVVAAENFWGSIARQLAGSTARVSSIIVSPATDPHSYEPTPADARVMAGARLAIVNGIGYDAWASRLLSASPLAGRRILNVGSLLGIGQGGNPHQWYSPVVVGEAARAITADLVRLVPARRTYLQARLRWFQTRALARYDGLIATIRARFSGTPVGYSESIFAPLGHALGLRLKTPPSFARAVAEGSEVSAADLLTVERQASRREIRVWIFNSQNATPEVTHVNALARAAGVPVATVTETLSPASDSFQQWQVSELEGLLRALERGTKR